MLDYRARVGIAKAVLAENNGCCLRGSAEDEGGSRRGLEDAMTAVGQSASSLLASLLGKTLAPIQVVEPLCDLVVASAAAAQGHLPISLRLLMAEHLLPHITNGLKKCIAARLQRLDEMRLLCLVMAEFNLGRRTSGGSRGVAGPLQEATLENSLLFFDEACLELRVSCEMALRVLLLMCDPRGAGVGGRGINPPDPPGLSQMPPGQAFSSLSPAVDRRVSSCEQPGGVSMAGPRADSSSYLLHALQEAGAVTLLEGIGHSVTAAIAFERDLSSMAGSEEADSVRDHLQVGLVDFIRASVDPLFCCIDRLPAFGAAAAAAESGRLVYFAQRSGVADSSSEAFLLIPSYLACCCCYVVMIPFVNLMEWAAANDSLFGSGAAIVGTHRSSLLLQRLFGSLILCAKELTSSALSSEGPLSSGKKAAGMDDGLESLLERVEEEAFAAAMALARLAALNQVLDTEQCLDAFRRSLNGVLSVADALRDAAAAFMKRQI